MSLLNTDMACANLGNNEMYLYYQYGQDILESHSTDGKSWEENSTPVAKDGSYTGSAICAYYVDKDANFSKNKTVHMLYINQNNNLIELVKTLSDGKWQEVKLADEVRKGPTQNSRLCGGAYNYGGGWNPEGSQWVYYSSINGSDQVLTEIRRTPSGDWHTETLLKEEWGMALPGTSLSCTIVSGEIQLFFQDHDYNIRLYRNRSNSWTDEGPILTRNEVQATTPLASVKTNSGSNNLFYAGTTNQIMHTVDENTHNEVVPFYPGSKLGTTASGETVILFYRSLNPAGEVVTMTHQNGQWSDGNTVIAA